MGVLFVLSIVAYLDRLIVSLMIPMIKADFGVSDSRIALMQGAAFSVVYGVFTFPFGYAVDRWSRRGVLFVGVFLWGIAAMASGLAGSFSALLIARLGIGVGEAALSPAVASILSDLFPKRRLAFAFAVVSVGASIGTQGALILGGAILHWAGAGVTVPFLGHLAPWKIAFLLTGAPGVLFAFLVFAIPEPPRRAEARGAGGAPAAWADAWPFLKRHGGFIAGYTGAFTALAIASYGLLIWAPTVLQRVHHLSASETGLTLGSASLVAGLTGTLAAGVIVDFLYGRGRRDAHVLYYAVAGAAAVVIGVGSIFAGSPWTYLALILPLKFLFNFAGVAQAGLQVMTPAHLRGRMAALFAFCTVLVGSAVGPSAVAVFTDVIFRDEAKLDWSVGCSMALFGLVATVLLLAVRGPMRRAGEANADSAPEERAAVDVQRLAGHRAGGVGHQP